MRKVDELVEVDDPAWPQLQELFAASAVPLKVLPVDGGEGRRGLQLQVTVRSVLGAVVLHSGGLLLDGDGCVCSAAGPAMAAMACRAWRR